MGIAREQATLATRQVEAAQRLADAERLRFEEGASELVVVNLRELAAAESQRLEVKALEAYQRAWAEYVTSLGERVSP
ncbi:MAG: hypothetical protein EBZ76_14130 [Synechococcaceae bacterium WB9_2_170]|nr:hypothetical protein [Synechococcaceae bacterium WB9_2_170]